MSELQKDDLDRLVEQLKTEEVNAEDARLSSLESLQQWILTNPVLQKTGVIDAVNQYGPAVIQIIKRLLGL